MPLRSILAVLPAVLIAAAAAPSAAATTLMDNGDFHTVVDATAGGAFATGHHDFTYYSFATRDVVQLTDDEAAQSGAWDIAFKRSEIKLNGGISGPKGVVGVNLHGADGVVAEAAFEAVDANKLPGRGDFVADGPAYAMGDWYAYDAVSHQISSSRNAYQIRTADGQFGKIVVDAIEGGGREDAGQITFRWVLADGVDLSGEPRQATVDVASGADVYFNLTSGKAVSPADPASSTEWDLHLTGYTIRVNGGISGPGEGGAFPAYQTGDTFDGITEAIGFGYFTDKAGSAFSSDSGEWYNYDSTTHFLSTRHHVYVIDTGEGLYKMQLLNFYQEIEGAPVSGYISFRWRLLGNAPETAVEAASWGRLKANVWSR
ncbi:MAG: hypothetical protein CME05_03970 [Gemmatimonadaceae bacterium]|nr:hypothetical protein [Gemmatimonadaceae bacterium]